MKTRVLNRTLYLFCFFCLSFYLPTTSLAQDDACFCGGDLTIGNPSDPDCFWSLSIGTGANEHVITEPGSYFLALPSPELNTIAMTANCNGFSLPIFYNFCGVSDIISLDVDSLGLDFHEFQLTEDCTFNCAASECSCDIQYTITNNTDEDWFGSFNSLGAASECAQDIAVFSNSSVVYNGTIDANEVGENDVRYIISTTEIVNFSSSDDLTFSVTSGGCEPNDEITPQGNVWLIPENSDCGETSPCTVDGITCGAYDLYFDLCEYGEFSCGNEINNLCIKTTSPWDDTPNPNGLPDEVLGVTWEHSQNGATWTPLTNSQGGNTGICTDFNISQLPAGTIIRATIQIWGGETCFMFLELNELCPDPCEEDPDFEITVDTHCPPFQACPICLTGGEVCVTLDGGPIDGFAIFCFEDNVFLPAENGCLELSANLASTLNTIKVTIEECEYIIPVDFNDPNCDPFFSSGGNHNEKRNLDDQITIFPNPTKNLLQIYNSTEERLQGELHSIEGKLIKTFMLNAYDTEQMNVTEISNGVYFVKIINPITKEITRTEKVIIAH